MRQAHNPVKVSAINAAQDPSAAWGVGEPPGDLTTRRLALSCVDADAPPSTLATFTARTLAEAKRATADAVAELGVVEGCRR